MDPHSQIARRFPLIPRFRPACLPLSDRVQALVALADTAWDTGDNGIASAVFNQSALIASDIGMPDLARELCHRHAAAYLRACPLPSMNAIRGLEPVVNLARLRIRAGAGDEGREQLLRLYNAVRTGTAAQFEGVSVPAQLTASPDERQEVWAWLWRVLLADGTRTLTSAGRWTEALAHIKAHQGVGKRMLDGRQVAILAALTTGEADSTATLLMETEPGDPWEQAVTACLTVLCRQDVGHPVDHHLRELVNTYLGHEAGHGTTVFDVRLGLTFLDIIGSADGLPARRIADDIHRRTVSAADGYAAREVLAHPFFATLTTYQQVQDCHALVRACALGNGALAPELRRALTDALRASERVIQTSLQQHPIQEVLQKALDSEL
ncbi:hypothetical protein AB0N28_04300 [Streptomyces sp. NPDC051130]|uniref:hypothetical protein n=1 Tax=Streptomyces sp. NPDC051130 TaxID=3157223 RepID=UPI00344101B4